MSMKFKFRDRLLLMVCAVVALLGAVVTGALIVYGLRVGMPPEIQVMDLRVGALFGAANYWFWGLVALALALVAVWMLRLAFRTEPKHDKGSVSVQNTEHGDVRVSVQAIDMLVKRAIGNAEGLVDVKTRIINHEDSITVVVDMTLDCDVHIPNTTVLMQRNIKNFIEEYSGIAVRDVTILVSKIIEVTPRPPLQIESKSRTAPEVIDVPDAIAPDVAEPVTPVVPDPEPVAPDPGPAASEPEILEPEVLEPEISEPEASEPTASEDIAAKPEGEIDYDVVFKKDNW